MNKRPDGFYETSVNNLSGSNQTQSERIGVVIGSGVRGQTYLYWHGNRLYELPVSYWKDGHQWINSPGYVVNGSADFSRPVAPRCIECHAAYIDALAPAPLMNAYVKDSLVYGISCETCHGPGARHVALERSRSAQQRAMGKFAILNPAHFSRDRQVDQCALCHGGTARQEILPAFSYLPGQPLDRYSTPAPVNTGVPDDVHADEVGLLKLSACYRNSPSMSCSTCHNEHAPERSAASYSYTCLQCHTWQSCGESRKLGKAITQDCIDCHMPMLQTRMITATTTGKTLHTSIRTHWIKVYPVTKIPVEVWKAEQEQLSRR